MPLDSEVAPGLHEGVDEPAITRLLHAEISDENPDAFGENVEVLIALAREPGADHHFATADLKTLVRLLGRRFEARSGNQLFSRGVYQTFFSAVRAADAKHRARLEGQLLRLGQISALLDNDALAVRSLRPILLRLWGELCEDLPTQDDGRPYARLLPWCLFERLLRGVLRMETFSTAERTFHYATLASSAGLAASQRDERRQVLLADFRFSVGDDLPRRPTVQGFLPGVTALAPADRELLLQAVRSHRGGEVEPFALILRHHGWILACAEEDLREPYFALVEALFEHLLTRVFAEARGDDAGVLRIYLSLLRERHLPRLRRWCDAMRAARPGAELFADLLFEPYLLGVHALQGAREPSLAALVQDWMALQRVAERQAGYRGPALSLAERLRAHEASWLETRREALNAPRAASVGVEEPDGAAPAPRRRTRKATTEYDTFVRLPVQPAPQDNPVARPGASDPQAARRAPFDEDRETDPYGVPRLEADLFDAITQRLPSLGVELLDPEGATTLLLPSEEGRAGALYRAATIILPAKPLGEAEEGLHQAATLIFPVQSVPVSRNEAICRRVDVLLAAQREPAQRSSERLRVELQGMPDEDRIIAEQYLAQVIEREMARLAGRLRSVRGMSMVTLDDYAGSQLSAVLRDFAVTGYLRRVFVAECAGLYGNFDREELRDPELIESLQLAVFTVLNAHQERLALPLPLEQGLRALVGWPGEQPLPARLPYHYPDPIAYPQDLSARLASVGSWQLVFDAEYLLEGHVHELARYVDKVTSLELFMDLENALGATGFGVESYLALCAELRGRLRQIVDRARGLFVHLEEAGAASAELEPFLLELIGYGRGVWNRCMFPSLGFYAKMAFGTRD